MADDNGRSIGTVLKEIVGNVEQIVRSEIRLASAEVRQEAGKAGQSAALVLVGGAIAVLALGCALIAAISLLATIVALWSAALIVAAVAGVVGAAFMCGRYEANAADHNDADQDPGGARGEYPVGESTDQIEQEIIAERRQLGRNLRRARGEGATVG